MSDSHEEQLVVFIDVDNTLINNDKVKIDVDARMQAVIGLERTTRFWELYEIVRRDLDCVDIPATLRRIEPEYADRTLYRKLYRLWIDFPYTQYIYPGVFEGLAHLKTFTLPVILSDGDASFQLRKIVKSGLCKAVDGNVLIYQHKNHHFEDIASTFPARHYGMVEDKPNLLAAGKEYFGDELTTVLVKQGKYAAERSTYQPDIVLPAIGELQQINLEQIMQVKTQVSA